VSVVGCSVDDMTRTPTMGAGVMHRAHKVALDLNNVQAGYMARAAGTARFAYNWALAWWQDAYQQWQVDPTSCERPSEASARLHLNLVKHQDYQWMSQVTKCAPQEAIRDLGRAFTSFFAGRARYPRKHKRGRHDSFRVSAGFFKVDGDRLWLPHVGWVWLRERFRWPGAKLLNVTVSKHRGRWFASIACQLPGPVPVPRKAGPVVGVDVGTGEYVTSNGEHLSVPRAYRSAQRRLRRAQQALARKQPGSANWRKAQAKLARLHGVVADVRVDWLHQTTTRLVANSDVIAIEDLFVSGMTARPAPRPGAGKPGCFLPNRVGAKAGLNKSILDAGFGEFRRLLEYKCPERGVGLIVVDRWYPSSRVCSSCGVKTKRLPLRVRHWGCQECGAWHHRDLNAAINLRNYAASSAVSACGEFPATDLPSIPLGWSSHLCNAGTEHQTVSTNTFE